MKEEGLVKTGEEIRLEQSRNRSRHWKRWGPYLSERAWGTVREDYSAFGTAWDYFPHDHARSRAYRWNEDGIAGICDRHQRLCFALTLWNRRDPILKDRLFGLTGLEGNHGEDVQELYYYLDSTPTHSYMRYLYKYPQAEYPYAELVERNRQAGRAGREYELLDTGVFSEDRYFDVFIEYAKADVEDILIRIEVANLGPEKASLDLLPTLWFRNTWSWGGDSRHPVLRADTSAEARLAVSAEHPDEGSFFLHCDGAPELLFTENETNAERLFGVPNRTPYVKDGIEAYLIHGRAGAVNPDRVGTKCAARYQLSVEGGGRGAVWLRLNRHSPATGGAVGPDFEAIFAARKQEADEFYQRIIPADVSADARNVMRQALGGLLWSKQFYHYVVRGWLNGDPAQPLPPPERNFGRNREWAHLFNRDIISMPDKWEYPWFAAWDLAFHMVPFSKIDPHFAKKQLILFLREWYMHPNGQIPAYEFAFGDVNPPVHAWAAWRVYKMTGPRGKRDTAFLESVFQKLLLNFTWWVNRKDAEGNNLFSGGFLGLDNIGVFDRSKPLPTGGFLQQADGTAWMGFYCLTMLSMALELAQTNPVYEDMASKFFEHFIGISDAMNSLGGTGLWDEQDGFYYDQLKVDDQMIPLRTRSLIGLLPLIAVENLESVKINKLPGFKKRMEWFLNYRKDLAQLITYCEVCPFTGNRMLAIPTRERLQRALRYMLDENEFLSPFGLRSVSRVHHDQPYIFRVGNDEHRVDYVPGEGTSYLFGGNSNWRGPIWFPINFLIVEALERYHLFYGESFKVECPTGSGKMLTLKEVAEELSRRLSSIFLPDKDGARPCHGQIAKYADDPHWRDLVLFYGYFNGETGRGCGASHQTGWTALAVKLLENTIEHTDQSIQIDREPDGNT